MSTVSKLTILLTTGLVCVPVLAFPRNAGRTQSKQQTGDVFSTRTGGNSTKKTGTQGENHGKGGNKTCPTTRNTPDYDPRTCATTTSPCVLSSDPQKVFAMISDYWEKEFKARRQATPYRPPALISRDAPVHEKTPIALSAYHKEKRIIYLNLIDLKKYQGLDGEQVTMVWLAHEFGHHIQNLLPDTADYKLNEFQADQLAGVVLRHLHDQGCTFSTAGEKDDLEKIDRHLRFIADPTQLPPGSEHAHGTPKERLFNFHHGYRNPQEVWRNVLSPRAQ